MAIGLAAVAMAAGCGSGGGSCGGSAACGGNVVGTWSIASVCFMTLPAMSGDGGTSCSNQINSSGLTEMGTVTFNSDLTYTSSATPVGTLSEVIPTGCLGTVTCDQENMYAMMAVTSGTYSSAGCTAVAAGCSCQFQFASKPVTQTGTYTTAGSSLTIMSSTATKPQPDTYCVTGSTLTLSTTSMIGTTGTSSSIVLTKS
jgi:hypothetical protein